MNAFCRTAILPVAVFALGLEVLAGPPSGVANPFNVAGPTTAEVSPSGADVAVVIRKKRKLQQLASLRRLSEQNLVLINQFIDNLQSKIEDLKSKLDDAEDGEADDLKERIKGKEDQLEQLEKLRALFEQKIRQLNSQTALAKND